MNFSSRTTANDVHSSIMDVMDKHTKDTVGPPMGKRLLCFIDDLHMPAVDEYGTQQPIALLKLMIGRNGTYDRGRDLNWLHMKDVQYVARWDIPADLEAPSTLAFYRCSRYSSYSRRMRRI